MADEEFDPFAPGSNLKEDYDGVMKEVTFEKSTQGDNYTAHMVVLADDGEEIESFLSLGKDWATYDGGRTVEHPRGVKAKFNGQTGYSEWITFAMGGYEGNRADPDGKPADIERGLGAAAVMRERNRRLGNRGPQCAELWDGLRFHFDVLERRGRTRKGDEWVDTVVERMLPVRYLGTNAPTTAPSAVTPAPAPTPAASSPSPPPPFPAAGTVPAPGVHPALANLSAGDQARVRELAVKEDFGGFVDGVMRLSREGGGTMLEVPALIQALADEQFYLQLKGGSNG